MNQLSDCMESTCPCKDPCIEWYNRARDREQQLVREAKEKAIQMSEVYCKHGPNNCVFKQPAIDNIFYEAQRLAGEPVEIRLAPTLPVEPNSRGFFVTVRTLRLSGNSEVSLFAPDSPTFDTIRFAIARLCDTLRQMIQETLENTRRGHAAR